MSQDDKNKTSHSGAAPSFKIPTAAKLACMGLLSGTAAAPTVATAGIAFIPVPVAVEAVNDHYVTPVDTILSVLASTGSTKTLAQNDKLTSTAPGNATSTMNISALADCPNSGNASPQLNISLLTPPEHGNVIFSHTTCDGMGTTPNNFGSFEYQPATGYTGTDSFVYSIQIGEGTPSNATASILVGEQFAVGGGALDAALLAPFAVAAGWARRRKKTNSEK